MIPQYVDLTDSVVDSLGNLISKYDHTQIGVICDENTSKYCYPIIKDALPEHRKWDIKSGEEYKVLNTCEFIWENMTSSGFDRKSLLINLGGGVIGDMGGFCAATFKRGIDFIQIPTTLLAQVDASIGGKLGIDFKGLKNHVGVFKDPLTVIIDPVFLKTLPERQLKSGFAEVLKHGLIRDREIFQRLMEVTDISSQNWKNVISDSIRIKSEIVNSDPFEKGPRKLLNFGHTIGHAIESLQLNIPEKKLLHGEAIAIGIICEAWISVKKLNLAEDQLNLISRHIPKIFGKVDLDGLNDSLFIEILQQDKKNKGNSLLFTLLSEIGNAKFDIAVNPNETLESLAYYKSL